MLGLLVQNQSHRAGTHLRQNLFAGFLIRPSSQEKWSPPIPGRFKDLKNLANNSHFYLITAVHICQDLRIRGCRMVAGNQTATKRGTKMSGGKRIGLREIRALGTNQTIWMARWPDLECGAAREPPWCIS